MIKKILLITIFISIPTTLIHAQQAQQTQPITLYYSLSAGVDQTGDLGKVQLGLNLNSTFYQSPWYIAVNKTREYYKETLLNDILTTSLTIDFPLRKFGDGNKISIIGSYRTKDSTDFEPNMVKETIDLTINLIRKLTNSLSLGIGVNRRIYKYQTYNQSFTNLSIPINLTKLKLIKADNSITLDSSINTTLSKDEKLSGITSTLTIPISKTVSIKFSYKDALYDWEIKKINKLKSTPTFTTAFIYEGKIERWLRE